MTTREIAMGWSLLKHTIDPVCGKRIKPHKSDIAAIHEGRSFFFCSYHCWASFQATPTQFLDTSAPTPKGWWGRYLQRIGKATQDKPPCCH
jgi:YHS domain-containing protein